MDNSTVWCGDCRNHVKPATHCEVCGWEIAKTHELQQNCLRNAIWHLQLADSILTTAQQEHTQPNTVGWKIISAAIKAREAIEICEKLLNMQDTNV